MENKKVHKWNLNDCHKYFKQFLNNDIEDLDLMIRLSKNLSNEENYYIQKLIAESYFNQEFQNGRDIIPEILKEIHIDEQKNATDYHLKVMLPSPTGSAIDFIIPCKFKHDMLDLGYTFSDIFIEGLGAYLKNQQESQGILIVIEFLNDKLIQMFNNENQKILERNIFMFNFNDTKIHGVTVENLAKFYEFDGNNHYIGKIAGSNYKDSNVILAEIEVQNFLQEFKSSRKSLSL
jgi:hypothetical protein